MINGHLDRCRPSTNRGTAINLNWGASPLCQPFPEADADRDARSSGSVTSWPKAVACMRQVGHDAIFAMQSNQGLSSALLPELQPHRSRIDGVCRLIRSFMAWRRMILWDPEVDPPPFEDSEAVSRFILRDGRLLPSIKFVGFGTGVRGTYADLWSRRESSSPRWETCWSMFESCRTSVSQMMSPLRVRRTARRCWTNSTNSGSQAKFSAAPRHEVLGSSAGYIIALGIGHVFKYPYSYYDLLRRANEPGFGKSPVGREGVSPLLIRFLVAAHGPA